MKFKNAICMIGIGVGGTILYQQIKNGNLRKIVRKMNSSKTKMLEDMENLLSE